MTKRKSIIATSILTFALCLTLVFSICLSVTHIARAEDNEKLPQIVSVVDEKGNVTEVDENMLNLPVGIVGDEYHAKIVTANKNDIVYIKPYAEGTRGCLPNGLVFNAETKEITGTPTESEGGVSRDVQIYCNNEYGSTNVRGWLNVYRADQKPTLPSEAIPPTAYVGSLYSAMIEVGGYNKYFKVTLEDSYPEGMNAYRNGAYACIQFTPTSDMAGETYNFTLCVDNELGVVKKECTITVANEVVAPNFITKTQPLGYTDENPNGVRPVVGKDFEFWLQASGTNTESNPIEFFAYDKNTNAKATPNSNNEYALGNGLFLTKDGKIYSNCVLETEGQAEGFESQIEFYIGASNSAEGNEQGTGKTRCYLQIVKGYVADSFTISPASTDIPKGGKRQFTANIKGVNIDGLNITWVIEGKQDENTSVNNNGLVTIGINETGYTNGDLIGKLEVVAYLIKGSRRKQCDKNAIITPVDHIHTTSVVEEKAKTCTENGNIKHYKCTICNGLFNDAGATENLTAEDVKIAAGHEYGDLIAEVPATCSATGKQAHYKCSACNKLFDSSKAEKTEEELTIAINNTAHHYGDWKNEVPATCASEGTKAHKDCTLCHKHFDNANNEITDLTIAKNDNHELESETVWSANTEGHYHKCNRTGCQDNGKVDFAAHTPDRSEATEENAVKCTVCDFIITPALGHTHHLTLVAGTAATCMADGKKAYYTCDGCSEKFEDEAGTIAITADIETWGIIPKAHKFGKWIAEVPATKEATGTKAHKDCEFCGKHFDNDGNEITDLTIAKLPLGGDQPGGEDNPGGNDNPGGEVVEPKQEGLSGGAIAGIVVGSVAVVGIGGFAIFWFAIRKKSFAELISAVKGIFKKK